MRKRPVRIFRPDILAALLLSSSGGFDSPVASETVAVAKVVAIMGRGRGSSMKAFSPEFPQGRIIRLGESVNAEERFSIRNTAARLQLCGVDRDLKYIDTSYSLQMPASCRAGRDAYKSFGAVATLLPQATVVADEGAAVTRTAQAQASGPITSTIADKKTDASSKPAAFSALRFYQVRSADDIETIADQFNTSPEAITAANDDAARKLVAGSFINVPVTSATPFSWPTPGKIVSKFGENGKDGIAIAAGPDAKVQSMHMGQVLFAGRYRALPGNVVVLGHGNELTSVYAGLDELLVRTGDKVDDGDAVGTVRSGILQFEVREKTRPIDPLTLAYHSPVWDPKP